MPLTPLNSKAYLTLPVLPAAFGKPVSNRGVDGICEGSGTPSADSRQRGRGKGMAFAPTHPAHFAPHAPRSLTRDCGCFTCAHFHGHYLAAQLVCAQGGGMQVIGSPKVDIAFWRLGTKPLPLLWIMVLNAIRPAVPNIASAGKRGRVAR